LTIHSRIYILASHPLRHWLSKRSENESLGKKLFFKN
jgi:hypothetical protein